jgi:hypothetical protein
VRADVILDRLKDGFLRHRASGGAYKEFSSTHEAGGYIKLAMVAVEAVVMGGLPPVQVARETITLASRALSVVMWLKVVDINEACALALAECDRGISKHGLHQNLIEGYAVLLEEVDEFWAGVMTNATAEELAGEAIQVVAMAVKLLVFLEQNEQRVAVIGSGSGLS